MGISSTGLGSGVPIDSIVSQLVALERAPLAPLQTQATKFQSKISVFGTLTSMMNSLGELGNKLADPNAFKTVKGSSSLAAAVGITVAAGTAPTAMSVEVQQLAKAQSTATVAVPKDTAMGAGNLKITLGDWSSGAFVAGDKAAVDIEIVEGEDTLTQIAAKINAADAGVTATVLRDASGERLLMRSKDTGEALGFEVQATDADGVATDGLSRLAVQTGVASGVQITHGANALATINGIDIESASNTYKDGLPGITLQFAQLTTAPVEVSVSIDKEAMTKTIQSFVDAYNSLNDMLTSTTGYNPDTKVAGSLQGDSTAVGLQGALRGMMRSFTPGGEFTTLASIGIDIKSGGKMGIDSTKLSAALDKPDAVQNLFNADHIDPTAQGFGEKLKSFADGFAGASGTLTSRTESLRAAVTRNTREQEKVNERANRAETRFLKQYNAMDAMVGQLNSLNAFVTQQIAQWNKTS
ncbi:flagellar filament capping protein FliD [Hydrogenophaga sp.]|uniref:flagellar filament capping protein FliD n=1 Tax=Hydrogenophaga sp. TaxID=1904254 RepID=UPI0027195985|nr:flagellar filament capping protein FliD [Hydrogenophaga sp.]MDO9437944.1 flagellar filament capping protein FliD [Hydrogenophaga sp.]